MSERNPDSYRESNRKWRDANKEYFAQYRETHRDEHRAAVSKWKREHPEEVADYKAKYHKLNPEKVSARYAVRHAVESGAMSRGPCEECGVTDDIHGHHDDYDRPLDVRWLCSEHHHSFHRKVGT